MSNVVRFGDLQAARQPEDLFRARERRNFEERFPPLPPAEPIPTISWAEIERQLEDLAPTPESKTTARWLFQRLKTDATWRPPEMFFRQLALVCAVVLEEFSPPSGEAPMT